uniref:Uncharacterized protein n=1 Tax=Anguilla anguilla TaxID=7936 RepID=A0A0E9RIX4_ANGAN
MLKAVDVLTMSWLTQYPQCCMAVRNSAFGVADWGGGSLL